MDRKPIAVLIVFLAIFAILLPGCVTPSASPDTTGPETPDNYSLQSDRIAGPDTMWWIQIDPLPEIPVNGSLVISGTTNLPEGTWLNYHVLLASRDGAGGTPSDNYGDFSSSIDVSRGHGTGVWSAAISLDPAMPGRNISFPDRCIVHVTAIQQNIYATSLVPVTLPPAGEAPCQVRFNPVGNASLHHPFPLNGTTDLPAGYLLSASVYPGIHPEERSGPAFNYDPLVQEFVTVGKNSDGTRVFSVTVNLSGQTDQDGDPLTPGDYFAEIHAINMNSTVSGSQVISLSEEDLRVHIDPIEGPAKGTNLTITGTTSLQPGQHVYVHLGTASHPCPIPTGKLPDHDTQWTCGGSSCSVAGLNQPVIVQQGTGNTSVWRFETSTANWCLNEQYFIRMTTGESETGSRDFAYFNIH